jgi:hypothetical protein
MQWLKQTFTVRFNLRVGRTGHRWGDRYWSEVLKGEPPEGAGAVDWKAMEAEAKAPTAADIRRRRKLEGVRPQQAENGAETPFSPEIPLRAASPPPKTWQGVPLAAKAFSQQAPALPAGNGHRRGLPVAARGHVGLRRTVLEQAHITGKLTAKARKATLNSFLLYPFARLLRLCGFTFLSAGNYRSNCGSSLAQRGGVLNPQGNKINTDTLSLCLLVLTA